VTSRNWKIALCFNKSRFWNYNERPEEVAKEKKIQLQEKKDLQRSFYLQFNVHFLALICPIKTSVYLLFT
jgi:hypothetical protein